MDIDIVLDSHLSSQELTDLGLLAEQYGIRCVWNASYLDGRDPFTNLAQLARESSRIKVAPMALNGYEMHPFRITMALLTLNELAPGDSAVKTNQGNMYFLQQDFKSATQYYQRAIELDSEDGGIWINLSMAKFKAGELKQARNSYQNAVQINASLKDDYSAYSKLLSK